MANKELSLERIRKRGKQAKKKSSKSKPAGSLLLTLINLCRIMTLLLLSGFHSSSAQVPELHCLPFYSTQPFQ